MTTRLRLVLVMIFVSSFFVAGDGLEYEVTEILTSCDFSSDLCGWTDDGLTYCHLSDSSLVPSISPEGGCQSFLYCGTRGEPISSSVWSPSVTVRNTYVRVSFLLWLDDDVQWSLNYRGTKEDSAIPFDGLQQGNIQRSAWNFIEHTAKSADLRWQTFQIQLALESRSLTPETFLAAMCQFRLEGLEELVTTTQVTTNTMTESNRVTTGTTESESVTTSYATTYTPGPPPDPQIPKIWIIIVIVAASIAGVGLLALVVYLIIRGIRGRRDRMV